MFRKISLIVNQQICQYRAADELTPHPCFNRRKRGDASRCKASMPLARCSSKHYYVRVHTVVGHDWSLEELAHRPDSAETVAPVTCKACKAHDQSRCETST